MTIHLNGSSKIMIREVRRDLDKAYAGLFRLTYPDMTDAGTQVELIELRQQISEMLTKLRKYEDV